jgi:hypothetical protein
MEDIDMKANIAKLSIFTSIILFGVISCNNNNVHMPLSNLHTNDSKQSNQPSSGPYYTTDILPIIKNNCMPCHDAGTDKDWTNYSIFKTKKALIEFRVLSIPPTMPPSKPLSDEDKATLKKWLDAGMPYAPAGNSAQDSNSQVKPEQPVSELPKSDLPQPGVTAPTGPVPSDEIPAVMTYEKDALPIFNQYCSKCHNNSTGESLDPKNKLHNWLSYKVAFYFKDLIPEKMDKKIMPPPWANIEMPDEARQILVSWVKHGGVQAPISYQEKILPLVKNNCQACHNETTTPPQFNWLDYKIASEHKQDIYNKVFVEKDPAKKMPLGGDLSPEDADTLKLWLETGANP